MGSRTQMQSFTQKKGTVRYQKSKCLGARLRQNRDQELPNTGTRFIWHKDSGKVQVETIMDTTDNHRVHQDKAGSEADSGTQAA